MTLMAGRRQLSPQLSFKAMAAVLTATTRSEQARAVAQLIHTVCPEFLCWCFVPGLGPEALALVSSNDATGSLPLAPLAPAPTIPATGQPSVAPELSHDLHKAVSTLIAQQGPGFGQVMLPTDRASRYVLLRDGEETVLGVIGVIVGRDNDLRPEQEAALELLAASLAHHLEVHALRAELAQERWLANLGEMVSPLIHEYRNVFNTVLWQVRLLELSVPAEAKETINTLAALLRNGPEKIDAQLAHRKKRPAAATRPLVLAEYLQAGLSNQSVQVAAIAVGAPETWGITRVAPFLKPRWPSVTVAATRPDLARLVHLLLRNVGNTVPEKHVLQITATEEAKTITLTFAAIEEEANSGGQYWKNGRAGLPVWERGINGLEFQAAGNIVGRLGGVLNGQGKGGKDLPWVLTLPVAPVPF